MTMSKVFKDMLTCSDNDSYDNGRVICFLSFIVYFILGCVSAHSGHPWTALDFAGGVGTMAVGFGVNLRLKKETEPQSK